MSGFRLANFSTPIKLQSGNKVFNLFKYRGTNVTIVQLNRVDYKIKPDAGGNWFYDEN